jgi:fatty acid-binding protein DegV
MKIMEKIPSHKMVFIKINSLLDKNSQANTSNFKKNQIYLNLNRKLTKKAQPKKQFLLQKYPHKNMKKAINWLIIK